MRSDETELWREPEGKTDRVCVMISCCTGAELQIRKGDAILLRELYPDKATLYERAAELRSLGAPVASRRRPTLVDDTRQT
jgi:hypothetical protein